MPDFLLALVTDSQFMPHGHCYLWTPSLLWLYVISDLAIGAAYYSIPIALLYFVRKRRDLQFNWIFVLFSFFIFACGTTHLIAIWTIWRPVYWLDASLKAVTASLSMVTATMLWPLIPKALRVASPEQLQAVISQLEHEVHERKQAEAALAHLNETLEQRVFLRTTELQNSNQRLASEIDMRIRAEERFRRVVEYAPNAMVMTNRDGIIEMVNAQAEQIFSYARTDLLGKSIDLLVPERLRQRHPQLRASFHATPGSRAMGEGRELYGVRRDGSEVPVEIALNPVETDEGVKVLAAIVDISDRKQKEERIQAALKEKVTLLAEVHHRVKNNLQIIHSLLDLQSAQTSDPAVRAMFQNSMSRIHSMALIHQTLYESNDFARVALDEVLKTLISNVATSFGADDKNVMIEVNIAEIELPITQAIPCGLIVNELVTNALKHAFPHAGENVVNVKLILDGHQVSLAVSDNGVGLNSHFDIRSSPTLGLELVTLLTDQLGGELIIQHANPTCFTVRFAQTHG